MDREMSGGASNAQSARNDRGLSRVLIVDDEPLIGTTLKVLLADEHEVTVAQSGSEARQFLRDDPNFDVILCDLMMPEISGMDLFAWLHDESPDLSKRMIFMTGGVFTEEARSFLASVPNGRIEKPFDHDDLLRRIKDLDGTP
ncbi:MAG: hypothetical protein DRJ42_11150 [Deltaproteobacteria bacterium]|nr:MAG: hypothetical protein DRJ42_11150 [Deltaproteobacteria bacterium]